MTSDRRPTHAGDGSDGFSVEEEEKRSLVYRLWMLEQEGLRLSRRWSVDDDLDELRFEYQNLLRDRRWRKEQERLRNEPAFRQWLYDLHQEVHRRNMQQSWIDAAAARRGKDEPSDV